MRERSSRVKEYHIEMLEENRGKIENGETIADLLYRYMTNQ